MSKLETITQLTNNISIEKEEKSSQSNKKYDKTHDKNSHELNNFKYNTNLLGNQTQNNKAQKKKTPIDIDDILDKESKMNKLEPWCKLDKTVKLNKLAIYSDNLIKEHNLSQDERDHLKSYFSNCLDKKHLQKVKDVVYDKETGLIKNIPCLSFNNTTRKFVLKKDKHVSTLKSLAPKKKKENLTITDELDGLEIKD